MIEAREIIEREENGNGGLLSWQAIRRLTKDLKRAGLTLGPDEARFIVSAYYRTQDDRIRYNAQIREMKTSEEPHTLLTWFSEQATTLENQLKAALDSYSVSTPAGRWMRAYALGVGPVIASGLTAHIDLMPWKCRKQPKRDPLCMDGSPCEAGCGFKPVEYAGQIWSYAGLNPDAKWEKGQVRPWNAELKTIAAYKLGESFVWTKSNPNDTYGHLFAERKEQEWQKNLEGGNAEAALIKSKDVGKSTIAYKWYSGQINPKWAKEFLASGKSWPQSIPKKAMKGKGVPMLPPAHIHARARRWVSKLFLSHLFEVMYIALHKRAPEQPFVLTMDEHSKKIPVPSLHLWMDEEGITL